MLGFVLHRRFSDVVNDKERAANSRCSSRTTSIKPPNTVFAVDLTQRASGVSVRRGRHVSLHARLRRIHRVRHHRRHGTRKARSRDTRGLFVLAKKWVHGFPMEMVKDELNYIAKKYISFFPNMTKAEIIIKGIIK